VSPAPLARRRAQLVRGAVLFVDVEGFGRLSRELGVERAYLVVTRCVRLLDGVVRRHGGAVDKYLGDRLLAVFGHPVPVPDPPRAAVEAALELRERVADYNREPDVLLPLGIHVGIQSGEFVAGDVRGGAVLREFSVLGDTVNTAARLNGRARDGQIFVGAPVFEATRDGFVYQALEPLRLKGKAQPVQAYQLLAARADANPVSGSRAARAEVARVGRERELAALSEAVTRLAAGDGGVLLLEGEEGSGKSRLLEELRCAGTLAKVERLQVRAGGDGSHGSPFAQRLVSAWSGVAPGSDARKSRPLLAQRLARHQPESEAARDAERLARWLETGRAADPEALREAVVRALCPPAPGTPLLVVVEDAHRADPESLELLRALVRAARDRPLLHLLCLRPDEAGAAGVRALAQDAAKGSARTVALAPLPAEAARVLARAAAPDAELGDATLDLVLERGRGVPGRILAAAFLAPALRWAADVERQMQVERPSQAERRRASVLFADITGFTPLTEQLGAEAAYPVVDAAVALLDRVAREHGGTVDNHQGDCVLALFGVPRALEDAPRAAVNAAIDMRRRLRAFVEEHGLEPRLEVHSGIATGLGIAGDVSGPMLREFAVLGDHVDLADALTHQAAAGQILVDAETRRFTQDLFEYQPGERLSLPEGGSAASFEVRSTAPRLHRARLGAERRIFSALVGREAELAQVRERLVALGRGEGGVVSLLAEAGLGKSRLVAELARLEEARACTWLEGRALSTGRNLSFHPLADMLRAWAEILDEDEDEGRAKLEARLAATLGADARGAFPLLANLMGLGLRPDEREWLDRIVPESRENLVRGALTQLLREGSGRQPIVVVMEDLHWADLSTIELLESLLRLVDEHPILFLNAARPGFPDTSGRVLARAREHHADRHVELALRPLDAEACRMLVRNLFRGGDLPHHTRRLIEEKAQGNPFYLEEVVRALADAGAVELRDGAFHATAALERFEIPGSVREAVLARVDRLELRRRSVLQAASVIGGSFHRDVLEELVDDGSSVDEVLEELQHGEFIEPTDRSAGVEYAFKHPLIQEVTYDGLLEAQRQALHLAVARATERRLSDAVPGFYAMLAYHYGLGRAAERAEEFLFRAGDEAARLAASSEALHFFQEASRLYLELHADGGDPGKRALLEKNVGRALFQRGQEPKSAEHFDRALELLGVRVPQSALALQVRFARDLLAVLTPLYVGRRPLRPTATLREQEIIEISFLRAISQTTSSPTRFVFDSLATLRRISRVDPRSIPEAGGKFAGAAGIFSYSGLSFDVSRRFLDYARSLIGSEEAPDALYYRVMRFAHHFLHGDWGAEHEIPRERLDAAQREGRLWDVTTYLGLFGEKRLRQGAFDAVRDTNEWIGGIWDTYGYDVARYNWLGMQVILALEERRLPEAVAAARRYHEESPQDLLHLLAEGWQAEAEILAGDAAAASESLARAERLLRGLGRAIPFHLGSYLNARLLYDVAALADTSGGERRVLARRARRSARRALGLASKLAYRAPQIFRTRGRLAWQLGDRAAALRWWRRSLERAAVLGMQPERARTCHEIAVHLGGGDGAPRELDGRGAAAWRDEARGSYETRGLVWDLARLESGRAP
jgi:class 3 adenylate cyclase